MRVQAESILMESTGLSECLDRLASQMELLRPGSTYRLQFNKNFSFRDARELIPYLRSLGITTCYASPILKAQPGSMHGYDISDHNQINPEIGTEEEFQEMVAQIKANGMSLLLDTVPNHMGVGQGQNPWWQDVLENGSASKFAEYFDIDWDPLKPELRNKVLLPILGSQYGEELESGKLALTYADGGFRVQYYETTLPIDPQTNFLVLEGAGELGSNADADAVRELRGLLMGFAELPRNDSGEPGRAVKRQREIPFLKQRFRELVERSPEVRKVLDRAIAKFNGTPGDSRSYDAMHKLLEAQPYRLAHWRVSGEEINYRRFFDINDLIGLRMEDPAVFAATHGLTRRLLADGSIQGLRIDHPDGLLNPPQYLTRLQMLYVAAQCYGATPKPPLAENGIEVDVQTVFGQHDWMQNRAPLYVLVEKILEPGEDLPKQWPVDGTVGYDFTNLVNGVFIEGRSRKQFTNFYHRFIGGPVDVDTLIYESKKLIMDSALSSEVNVLGHMLNNISSTDRRARDFTLNTLREAIIETIACFPVYRTYIDERGTVTDRDRGYIQQAISRAKRRTGHTPALVFDFLQDILLLRASSDGGAPVYGYRKQLYFTLKFQQLTGPVMAKGLEDTACYIYNRFISVNEVGGSPREFGVEPDEFHRANAKRLESWPSSMLSTSTHDTKRSEDVRMRLDVLSELPRPWAAQAMRWRRINRTKKKTLSDGRTVPDANEEYLLYQTLVGTWPVKLLNGEPSAELNDDERSDYIKRIQAYMSKALHEAKLNLSWVNPNQEYVDAMNRFIERILTPGTEARPNSFLRLIEAFVSRVAANGAVNSLSQTLIKLTAPGVPDIYQGQELFDFSLVDPDNRRPIDFESRRMLLEELQRKTPSPEFMSELLRQWPDGRVKMWVTARALEFRNANLPLFNSGKYAPIRTTGDVERHVLGFVRMGEGKVAITAVTRLGLTLAGGEGETPLGEAWGGNEVILPPETTNQQLRNVMTGETLRVSREHTLPVAQLFRQFPVALLVNS
jgi:(1->4)-alpha-D-glucan 1-alpha-D-glucosylmutase